MSHYKDDNHGRSKVDDRYTRFPWSWGYFKESELYIILSGPKKTRTAISNSMSITGHDMYCNKLIEKFVQIITLTMFMKMTMTGGHDKI